MGLFDLCRNLADPIFHHLTGMERNHHSGGNNDLLTGLWIPRFARLTLADLEYSEIADFNPFLPAKHIDDHFKRLLNNLFRRLLGQTHFFGNRPDNFFFRHFTVLTLTINLIGLASRTRVFWQAPNPSLTSPEEIRDELHRTPSFGLSVDATTTTVKSCPRYPWNFSPATPAHLHAEATLKFKIPQSFDNSFSKSFSSGKISKIIPIFALLPNT